MAWSASVKTKDWFKTGTKDFGLQDIERAIKEGATFNDLGKLRNRAKALGLKEGSKVDPYLSYGFVNENEAKAKSLGNEDLKEFNKRGYSDELKWALFEKHRELRSKDSNIKIGPDAVVFEKALEKKIKNNRSAYRANVKTRVEALYKKYLGRSADSKGLETYVNNIISKGWSETKVASTLSNSTEGRKYTAQQDPTKTIKLPTTQTNNTDLTIGTANRAKVVNAFKNYLGREPSESDIKSYYKRSANDLADILKQSPEYKVKKAYKEVLGRDPDSKGLQAYQDKLKGGMTYDNLVKALKGSQEYKDKNPAAATAAKLGLQPAKIDEIYKKLLNRGADSGAKTNWTAKKINGKLATVADLEKSLKGSREYKIKAEFRKLNNNKWPTAAQWLKYNEKDASGKFKLSDADAVKKVSEDYKWKGPDTAKRFAESAASGTGSKKVFGPANYLQLLKDAKAAGQSLTDVRANFLHWVQHHGNQASILSEANRPGKAGGLFEMIKAGNAGVKDGKITGVSTYFGDYSKDAKAGEKFTEADYLAARAAGHTDFNIYRYLHSNTKLRGSDTYNTVRNNLITRSNTSFSRAITQKRDGDKTETIMAGVAHRGVMNDERFRNALENPLWLETAAKIGYLPTNWSKLSYNDLMKNWKGDRKTSDATSFQRGFTSKTQQPAQSLSQRGQKLAEKGQESGGYYGVLDFLRDGIVRQSKWSGDEFKALATQAQFDQIHGTARTTAAGGTGAYKAGKYWQQWGALGPPNLDRHTKDSAEEFNKGKDKSKHVKEGDLIAGSKGDLRIDQKLALRALLAPRYQDDLDKKVEEIENAFLNKVYKTKDANGKFLWQNAPDTWGLDLMKKVGGKPIGGPQFVSKAGTTTKTLSETWLNNLLYGTQIDWDYYKKDATYQKAARAIGIKNETYKTVDDIRAANVWIAAYLQGKDDFYASGDWVKHKPTFTKEGTDYKEDGTTVRLSDQIKEMWSGNRPSDVTFDSWLTPNKLSDITGQPGDLSIKVDKTYKAKRPSNLETKDFKNLKAGAT